MARASATAARAATSSASTFSLLPPLRAEALELRRLLPRPKSENLRLVLLCFASLPAMPPAVLLPPTTATLGLPRGARRTAVPSSAWNAVWHSPVGEVSGGVGAAEGVSSVSSCEDAGGALRASPAAVFASTQSSMSCLLVRGQFVRKRRCPGGSG